MEMQMEEAMTPSGEEEMDVKADVDTSVLDSDEEQLPKKFQVFVVLN